MTTCSLPIRLPFRSRLRFAATVCGATLIAALAPPAAGASPPVIRMSEQGIEYMSGGNDRADAAFLQMVAPRWSTQLEFTVHQGPAGAFPVPVQVRVRDAYNGFPVMQVQASGPLMLARLAPGSYDIEALAGGISVALPLTVVSGYPSKAQFVFPSNVDYAALAQPAHALAHVLTQAPDPGQRP